MTPEIMAARLDREVMPQRKMRYDRRAWHVVPHDGGTKWAPV